VRRDPRAEVPEPVAIASAAGDELWAIWVNGERRPPTGPHLSARDRGLTLADGVFETMLVRRGAVIRIDHHLARLVHALAALEIPVQPELRDWVLHAVRDVGGGDASLRLTVTRGRDAGGVAPPVDARPTAIVTMNPPPAFPAAVYEAGLAGHVASGRRNERAMTAGLKTLAYTDAVAAALEAQRAGADEALFLDTEGHCSEAASSNLFAWTGTTLVTPPLSCGALPGITRAAVLDLASALGVTSAERVFGLEELLGAEEAFLTSSLRGLAPLVRVGTHPIGSGAPGPLTRRLAEAYAALIARECAT
jgi:branched-chain amino acid aminotransferase